MQRYRVDVRSTRMTGFRINVAAESREAAEEEALRIARRTARETNAKNGANTYPTEIDAWRVERIRKIRGER